MVVQDRQKLEKCLRWLFVLLLSGLVSGCETVKQDSFTYNLWSDQTGASHCRPQADPELKLFVSEKPGDVLVEYNALGGHQKAARRRAYYLFASADRLAAGKPPRFVSTNLAAGLVPIIVLSPAAPPLARSCTNTIFAESHGATFTLHSPNYGPEDYKLPDYPDERLAGNLTRVALTPVAVTVDTTVAAAVVGAVGGVLAVLSLCESGSTLPGP